jgi:hypothetical protein
MHYLLCYLGRAQMAMERHIYTAFIPNAKLAEPGPRYTKTAILKIYKLRLYFFYFE